MHSFSSANDLLLLDGDGSVDTDVLIETTLLVNTSLIDITL